MLESDGHIFLGRKKLILNALVILVALISYVRRDFDARNISFVERFFMDRVSPLQEGVVTAQQGVGHLFDIYFLNMNAARENLLLQARLESMERELFSREEVLAENQRLRELLNFSGHEYWEQIIARVVGHDASSDFRVIRINRGRRHGVKLQSPVVTNRGLVGHVFRLSNNYADVITILDANNRVDAVIQRTRSQGIIEGHTGNRMVLKYISRTDPVILSDDVLTSGLGTIYPKGLRIGQVSQIEKHSYGISQKIYVTPRVNFEKLEEVIVLISTSEVESEEDDEHKIAKEVE